MNITITTDQIIWFCTFIGALAALWKIVKEAKKPNDELKAKVERHDQILGNDGKRLKDVEDSNQQILKCLHVIINHEINGNGIDKMKMVRDELNEYLINR